MFGDMQDLVVSRLRINTQKQRPEFVIGIRTAPSTNPIREGWLARARTIPAAQ